MVSVVLPSYNHARYLRGSMQSVLDQTYTDWELIVLDDQSQDESVKVAKSFDDPRIRVIENAENLGTYATQNRGIELAEGDWIAILNSDDRWLPRKLAVQIGLLESHAECAFCYSRGQIIDDDDLAWDEQNHHRDYPEESVHDLRPYLLDVNQVMASGLVFRKGLIWFRTDFRYCGDWMAAWQLACAGPAAFATEVLTEWRQHPDNSSKQLEKTIVEEVFMRTMLLRESTSQVGSKLWKRKRAACALDLCAHWLLLGRTAEARSACSIALREGTSAQKQTAAKRSLATLLPRDAAIARMWPSLDPKEFEGLGEKALQMIASPPTR